MTTRWQPTRCDCGSTRWRPAWVGGGWYCDDCSAPNPKNPGYPVRVRVRHLVADLRWQVRQLVLTDPQATAGESTAAHGAEGRPTTLSLGRGRTCSPAVSLLPHCPGCGERKILNGWRDEPGLDFGRAVCGRCAVDQVDLAPPATDEIECL